MLCVFMLNFLKLNVGMVSVVMLNFVMLSVVTSGAETLDLDYESSQGTLTEGTGSVQSTSSLR